MLRFLTLHGFAHIAPLQGWYEYEGQALAATLGVVERTSRTRSTAGSWRSMRSHPGPRRFSSASTASAR